MNLRSSFGWIAQSRKAQVAAGTLVTIVLTRLLTRAGLPAAQVDGICSALLTLGGVWIGSIALEDAGAKAGGVFPAPVGSGGQDGSDAKKNDAAGES